MTDLFKCCWYLCFVESNWKSFSSISIHSSNGNQIYSGWFTICWFANDVVTYFLSSPRNGIARNREAWPFTSTLVSQSQYQSQGATLVSYFRNVWQTLWSLLLFCWMISIPFYITIYIYHSLSSPRNEMTTGITGIMVAHSDSKIQSFIRIHCFYLVLCSQRRGRNNIFLFYFFFCCDWTIVSFDLHYYYASYVCMLCIFTYIYVFCCYAKRTRHTRSANTNNWTATAIRGIIIITNKPKSKLKIHSFNFSGVQIKICLLWLYFELYSIPFGESKYSPMPIPFPFCWNRNKMSSLKLYAVQFHRIIEMGFTHNKHKISTKCYDNGSGQSSRKGCDAMRTPIVLFLYVYIFADGLCGGVEYASIDIFMYMLIEARQVKTSCIYACRCSGTGHTYVWTLYVYINHI